MENMDINQKITAYFPGSWAVPFHDEREQMDAWARFVDLLVAISFMQIDHAPEESLSRVAAFMSEKDAEDLYEPKEIDEYKDRESIRGLYDSLLERGMNEKGRPISPLSRLLAALGTYEKWLVILAVTGASGRKYARLFSILQEGGSEITEPTLSLANDLSRFFMTEDERAAVYADVNESFLGRYIFMPEDEEGLRKPLRLEPTVRSFLAAGKGGVLRGKTGGVSDSVTELLDTPRSSYIAQEDAYMTLYETIEGVYSADEVDAPVCIELIGDAGSGKRFLLRKVAGWMNRKVLCVDAGRILGFDTDKRSRFCRDIILKSILFGWLVYLDRLPAWGDDEEEIGDLLMELEEGIYLLCAGGMSMMPTSLKQRLNGHIRKIEVPYPTAEIQRELWEEMADELWLCFPEEYDMTELVSKYKMNPGRIAEALYHTSLSLPVDEDDGEDGTKVFDDLGRRIIDLSTLEKEIRELSTTDFAENATRLKSPFTWDDLVVSDKSRHLLTLACNRVRYSATVNDRFGFGKKLPYGRGVAIVLYGPPGTGKTMAAQVIAAELNLDIFRVDLSQISSKYIGETEKNLGAIFDAAKNSNAILFFDEADSLFSKRTVVNSSNDKYANAETSYLLQKIEEYEGVSVLATNNMQNFDVAFKRRMTYLIPIEAPDEKTRLILWEKVFPPETPLEPSIDRGLLAKALELTGAQIKSIAVASAYLAAAEGRSISYEDIIECVDLECAKVGHLNMGETLRTAMMTHI